MINEWESMCRKYSIKTVGFTSYQSFRSCREQQPKHSLFTRDDTGTEPQFILTPLGQSLINEGIFIVFDEAQNLKNDSDQFRASSLLCRAVWDTPSAFAMLSGSLFDKEKHTLQLLRILGFIKNIKDPELPRAEEIEPLVKVCETMDAEATDEVLSGTPLVEGLLEHLCFQLFTKVIKPAMVSSMPPPILQANKYMRNSYYNMDPESSEALSAGVKKLLAATNGNKDLGDLAMGAITMAMNQIEMAKVPIFIRVTKETLNNDPMAKVVVCLSYTNSIACVNSMLTEYRPMVLTGKTPENTRSNYIKLFQTNDDNRLIIMNLAISSGISLHDTQGNRPRHMFLSPTFKILDVHQAAGRVIRCGMLSDAYINVVYGKSARNETSILSSMVKKAEILKEIHDVQVEGGILFPSDYAKYIEPDPEE
jgi:hypothetical protein